jgi:hypothetical protein
MVGSLTVAGSYRSETNQHKVANHDRRKLPPQRVTTDFPVLSAGRTPHVPLDQWEFKIDDGITFSLRLAFPPSIRRAWIGRCFATCLPRRLRLITLGYAMVETRHLLGRRFPRYDIGWCQNRCPYVLPCVLNDESSSERSSQQPGMDRVPI